MKEVVFVCLGAHLPHLAASLCCELHSGKHRKYGVELSLSLRSLLGSGSEGSQCGLVPLQCVSPRLGVKLRVRPRETVSVRSSETSLGERLGQ